MAAAITPPSAAEPNQRKPTTPITIANTSPFSKPTTTSRRTTRHIFDAVKSRVAKALTATVKDCVPAFPPIEATIGIKTAKATNWVIVASNWAITKDARIADTRLTANQEKRFFAVSRTRSLRLLSVTPARRRISSWLSSSSTAIASSMVIIPIRRLLSSTTGAEIKWY